MMGMMQIQIRTVRTRIIDFMLAPFGVGRWLGEPGFMSVAQIAEGAGCSKAQASRVLRKMVEKSEARQRDGRPRLYAAPLPKSEDNNAR